MTTFDYVSKRFLGCGLQQSAMRGIFGFEPTKTTITIKITSGEGAAGGNSETAGPVKNNVTPNRVMVNRIISCSA